MADREFTSESFGSSVFRLKNGGSAVNVSLPSRKSEILYNLLFESTYTMKSGTRAELTNLDAIALLKNVRSFTIDTVPATRANDDWDMVVSSVTSKVADLQFTVWNKAHTAYDTFTFQPTDSTSNTEVNYRSSTEKADSLTANDVFYMFGNYPFDLTKVPIITHQGEQAKVYTYSSSPSDEDEYCVEFYDDSGATKVTDFDSLPLKGERPITNEEVSAVAGKTYRMQILLGTAKTKLFASAANAPMLKPLKVTEWTNRVIQPRLELGSEDIGKRISDIPLKITLRAGQTGTAGNDVESDTFTDGEGNTTTNFDSVFTKDNVTLKSLAPSMYSVPRMFGTLKAGSNKVEMVRTADRYINDRTGEKGFSETSKYIKDGLEGEILEMRVGPEETDPNSLELCVVKGSLSSLGFSQGLGKKGKYLGNFPSDLDYWKEYDFLFSKSNVITVNGENHLWTLGSQFVLHVYGILYEGNDSETAKVVLFDNWKPEYDGQSNIEVTFPCYDEDNASLIENCRFGTLFGTENAKNRLFVSGNTEHGNMDWHSADTGTDGDLSYFPDDSYCIYGQGSNSVKGYGIVSDGKLLVGMGYSDKEPTVYYRTATYSYLRDSQGNVVSFNGNSLTQESFPRTTTSSHIGMAEPWLTTGFNGDLLWVSDNDHSIVGLDQVGTTFDTQRIASTRSYCIDSYIKDPASVDPEKSLLYADGNTLYYATPECLFVSDYDLNKSRNAYEWFREDISGIRCIAHAKLLGRDWLAMGTEDGRILSFTDDWCDYEKIRIKRDTDIKWDSENSRLSVNDETIKHVSEEGYDSLWLVSRNNHVTRYSITGYEDGETSDWIKAEDEAGNSDFSDKMNSTQAFRIYLVKEANVNAYYITAPILYDYAHALKTVWSYTVIFDTANESEVKLEQATNETTYDRMVYKAQATGTIDTNRGTVDLTDFALGSVSQQKKRLPHLYTQYRPFVAPFFALTFESSSNIDSVLTMAQISYSYSGNRYTGDSRS